MTKLKTLNLKYALINNGGLLFLLIGMLMGRYTGHANPYFSISFVIAILVMIAYYIFVIRVIYRQSPVYNQSNWQITTTVKWVSGLGIFLTVFLAFGHPSGYYWLAFWLILMVRDYFAVSKTAFT